MLTFIKNSKGLLGMNARNLSYIRPSNLQDAIRLANNKLRSKEVLFGAGIPVPKIYGVIKNRKELEVFKWADLPKSFVLKPNCGGGGKGIKVIFGQNKNQSWVSTEGKRVTIKDLKDHIMDIFEGFYSFSGASDIAFFEERIQLLKILKPYSYKGIPDIRVIIYNKVPVMAMLRLPTRESEGKANLHMGGIGLGVDIATGVTTNAVMHDQLIEKHPDTKLKLSGIKIPHWREILEIAIKCQEVSKLGYIGVDIAIDSKCGPVVLEVNAHAGLSIQIANLAPLKYRLKKVSGLKVKNETHGIRIAQDLFGGEVEEEIEDISGKQVLGIIETIKIQGIMNPEDSGLGITNKEIEDVNKMPLQNPPSPLCERGKLSGEESVEKEIELKAKIDTGADRSSIDEELARKLGYENEIDEFQEVVKNLEIESNATKEVLDEKIKDELNKWGDDFDTVVIKSSHGVSYRLLIKMNIELSGIKLISKMSVIDRSSLEFPVIIGRRDLGKFLVDPSKVQSRLIPVSGNDEKKRNIKEIIKSILEAEKNKQEEDLLAKEKIIFYAEKIEKVAGEFNDLFSFIVPSGSEKRSSLAELSLFLEKETEQEYNPAFKYPVLKKFREEGFKSALKNIDNICESVKFENNDFVKRIIWEAASLSRNKINFLIAVKQKDEMKSFEYAKKIYGDISDDLVKKAEEVYQKLLERPEQDDDSQLANLKEKVFNSRQVKNKFEEVLKIMELSEWSVALDKDANQVDVKFNSAKYDSPTIVIPRKKKTNGLDLARKIIHEVIHLKTNSNNNALGFGGVIFGRDYELYQEGFARIISNDFINDIFGAEKELSNPYYILAMNKVKNGFNFHQVFDYICELKKQEYKIRNIDDYNAEEVSKKEALFICKRIFRGFRESLSKGKAYFPKDKMYLEGEILAKKMRTDNLENYLIVAKIDPYLLPLFIKFGIIDKENIKYNLSGDLEVYRKLFLEW